MSLEELISIERVELYTMKERIRETYVIANLTLSKLFTEILRNLEGSIIPLLDLRILLRVLKDVPYTNEMEGVHIHESLTICLEHELYAKSSEWSCKVIASKVEKLRDLILFDYLIDRKTFNIAGSVVTGISIFLGASALIRSMAFNYISFFLVLHFIIYLIVFVIYIYTYIQIRKVS